MAKCGMACKTKLALAGLDIRHLASAENTEVLADEDKFFFISKVKDRYVLEHVSNSGLAKPASVESNGGEKFLISRDTFDNTGLVKVTHRCSNEAMPKLAQPAKLEKIASLTEEQKQNLGRILNTYFNNVLGMPLGGAYGPPPQWMKEKKKEIAAALDECEKLENALGKNNFRPLSRFKGSLEKL